MAQRVLVGVLACGMLGFSGNAAEADSDRVYGGTISMPNTVVSTNTCLYAPIDYDLTRMPAGYNWTIDGESSNGDTVFDYGNGPSTGATDVEWCDEDLPGKFTVTGELIVKDENYEYIGSSPFNLSYNIRKMVTRASIRAGRKTAKVGQVYTLKGCITAHRKRDTYREFALETRRGSGKWTRPDGILPKTDGVGCYRELVTNTTPGTHYWRIRVFGDSISTTGYSKAVKVKVRKK